jgi:hypothetical protein
MALIHRSQLAGALPVCVAGDSRYFLDGAAVLPDGTVAATNGHVLVQLSPPELLRPEDAPEKLTGAAAVIPEPDPAHLNRATMIRRDDAKRLVAFTRNASAKRIPILQTVAVTPTNGEAGQATVTDLDTSISVTCPQDATFPKIARVIPELRPELKEDLSTSTFDARVLRQVLDSAIAQADANGHGKRPVLLTLQLNGPQKAARVDGTGFLGVVMPCRK